MGCSVEGAGKSLHLPRGDAPQAHTARGRVEGDFAQRQEGVTAPTAGQEGNHTSSHSCSTRGLRRYFAAIFGERLPT